MSKEPENTVLPGKRPTTFLDFATLERIASRYPRNPELDQDAQIRDIIPFMTRRISRLSRNSKEPESVDIPYVFPDHSLTYMLKEDCPTLEDAADFFLNEICLDTHTKPRRALLAGLKDDRSKTSALLAAQVLLCDLIYFPLDFYCHFYRMLWRTLESPLFLELGAPNERMTAKTVSASRHLGDMQVRLISALMRKNEAYATAARTLPFVAFREDEDFSMNYDEFFGKSNGNSLEHAVKWMRMVFGALTCHIGYFDNPQYGKIIQIYALRTKRSIDRYMVDKGLNIGSSSQRMILRDGISQIKSLTRIARIIREHYVSSVEQNELLQAHIDSQSRMLADSDESLARLRRQYDGLEAQLATMQQSIASVAELKDAYDRTREQITVEVRAEIEAAYGGLGRETEVLRKELADTKASLEHKIAALSRTRGELHQTRELLAARNTEVAELKKQVRVLGDRLERAETKVRFGYSMYVINAMKDPRIRDAVEKVEMLLLHNPRLAPPITTADRDNSYRNLRKYCPEAENFFKVHGLHNTCIGYTFFDRMVYFVWANYHHVYDVEITELKRKR